MTLRKQIQTSDEAEG